MTQDPIVQEVRRVRDEHAMRFGRDIRAIHRDMKAWEKRRCAKVVSFASLASGRSLTKLLPGRIPTLVTPDRP